MIDAAVATVVEIGVRRASTNEIARRAGVTWGVIQHHFATREGLFTATVEDAVARAVAQLDAIELVGADRRMRLRQLLRQVSDFFSRPEYVAVLQILWDLARDPESGGSALDAVLSHTVGLRARWDALFADAVGDGLDGSQLKAEMAYDLMWGFAVQEAANAYMADTRIEAYRAPNEVRTELLLDAIEGMLASSV